MAAKFFTLFLIKFICFLSVRFHFLQTNVCGLMGTLMPLNGLGCGTKNGS